MIIPNKDAFTDAVCGLVVAQQDGAVTNGVITFIGNKAPTHYYVLTATCGGEAVVLYLHPRPHFYTKLDAATYVNQMLVELQRRVDAIIQTQ